jgi:hypothetical protein
MTLEQLLVQTQLLSPLQLAVAQRDAQMRHKRLAPTLIDLGLVDEKHFAEWMAQVTRLPVVDPIPEDAVASLQRRLPRAIAREYEVVPLRMEGDELTIATINPFETAALDVLRTATGLKIRTVIARYGDLIRLLERFYPEDAVDPTILPPMAFGDESPGVSTVVIHAAPPVAPPSQLDRIEGQLSALMDQIDRLQKRIDAIDDVLHRVVRQ